ncbi:MAG: undecaprenyldiphospho-muramoylpentapeptide beta-N-acetylglucosaminyltransferase [Bacilli bacterium]|nr:undecaprenyldiphospho-muramoylpentapeptide beta-N-acetylglucosaminyltransferase [Bacilli bacterium]
MKYVVCAGGSGGHIYPAIAIINKIKEEDKNASFLYIGTSNRMEKDIIPKLGIDFVGLEIVGLNRKNIFKNISVLKKYNAAKREALKVLKEYAPDVVIGVGGYITLPVLKAAFKLGIPTVIHEQNSIPGLSNKLVKNKVNKICVSLPGSIKFFPKEKTVYTGNPRSEEIIKVDTVKKSELGFSEEDKLVIFVMGSLGSTTMTLKLKELIPGFKNKNYSVLVITGKNYYDEYKDLDVSDNVKIVEYCDNLINVLKDSDLIVSRAGASTIAEITAIGLPAILVPSPYVTHNHQYKNALELQEAGAIRLVTEEEFGRDKILSEIDRLFDNKELYDEMHNNSLKLGISDSSSRIYKVIKEVIAHDE